MKKGRLNIEETISSAYHRFKVSSMLTQFCFCWWEARSFCYCNYQKSTSWTCPGLYRWSIARECPAEGANRKDEVPFCWPDCVPLHSAESTHRKGHLYLTGRRHLLLWPGCELGSYLAQENPFPNLQKCPVQACLGSEAGSQVAQAFDRRHTWFIPSHLALLL